MGWIDTFKALLDTKSDAELGAYVRPEPPAPCVMSEIDMDLAVQLVLDSVGNWKMRKSLSDSAGANPSRIQVRRIRELVKAEIAERDAILNPPPEGEELP